MTENKKKEDFNYEDDFYAEEDNTQKDKFLIFRIAHEGYGIEIIYVTEIIGIQKITTVPDMPDFIRGVINSRGKIIPVMDIRTRFKLNFPEYDDRTCIIVVNINDTSIGLVVDEVSEVVDIPENQIEPAPKSGKKSSYFVKGIGKVGEDVKILLDVEKLLQNYETY